MDVRRARNNVYAIFFQGRRVYYADDTTVVILDMTTRMEEVERIELDAYIFDITVSNDGGTLFAGCSDNNARIVDLQTKKVMVLTGHTDAVRGIIPCEDGDVLTCSQDKTIRRWKRSTGECIRSYTGHNGWVFSILYDRETKRIISASGDKTIIVWSAQTGEQIGVMKGHSYPVQSIAWVDPTTIVSGGWDKTCKIWNTTTLTEIKTISSHNGFIYSVAVTPDGRYVVSGSYDSTVKVWSIATGECIKTLTHHSNHVYKVAVSQDGHWIASGDRDYSFALLTVDPPFSFIVHQGPLTHHHHRLLSDGSLLRSNQIVISISPSTRCFLHAETLTFSESLCLSAPSTSSACEWIEAISAVRNNLTLAKEKRSHTLSQMISRYRFDLLQVINFHYRRGGDRRYMPKDVVVVVGMYVHS